MWKFNRWRWFVRQSIIFIIMKHTACVSTQHISEEWNTGGMMLYENNPQRDSVTSLDMKRVMSSYTRRVKSVMFVLISQQFGTSCWSAGSFLLHTWVSDSLHDFSSSSSGSTEEFCEFCERDLKEKTKADSCTERHERQDCVYRQKN